MSTTVGPPLPPQILVVVITLDDSTYSFSTTETCMRKVDEYVTILLREVGRITVDTHDLVFTTGPPPHVSTLRIEEVIRNPSAPPFQRWRDFVELSTSVVTLYILPRNRPGAPDTVNKALAQSASPSEFADVNVFSQSQKEANTRLVDGFFIHNQKQLNASLACVPTRFFYDGFLAAAKDLRRIKTEDLEELKVRANKLFGDGKIVEGVTPDTAVERAHELSREHTMHYADELTLRANTRELGTDLLGLDKLSGETALKALWTGAKEAKVDCIHGLGRWPLVVEEWKKEDGAGHERLQGAQGFRKHLVWVTTKPHNVDDAHVPAPVNPNRGVFPGLVLSHRGADVTVSFILRSGTSFAYEIGESLRLSKDGATDKRNELGDTRIAVFFGTVAKLCREMYAFVCAPGVAPCLPNVLCGGQGEFGSESTRLREDPRVLKTTWTPPGATSPLDVVVKFMTKSSYGKKAQELAGRFAPKLHYYGHVDEGFYVAVMDFIPIGVPLSVAHESTLKELRQHLKDHDIVHGDLRPQNLVFGLDGSVTVLDWDWGGVRSQENPRYPLAMNPTWQWHERAVGEGWIEHEHDCYELDKLHAEIDQMKREGAQKRKAEEDAQGAEERKGMAPPSQ